MRTIEHLLGITGRLLIWVAGALVLEELTLAGLARLIVRRISEVRVARAESGASLALRPVPQFEQAGFKENVHVDR